MTNLPATVFKRIENEFKDIIKFPREAIGDITSTKDMKVRLYILKDDSKFYVTEYVKNGMIECSFYDWYSENDKMLLKFGSEAHKDEKYQTDTEPFHIHYLDIKGQTKDLRYPNHNYRELRDVMEFIRLMLDLKPKFIENALAENKKGKKTKK
jgi:uncharacterized protein YodC (DUF2158 family)